MGKGLRDILIDQLRDLGLSRRLVRRLVPPRGKSWNKLSEHFESLIRLVAYRVRVELELGANIRPKLFKNAINAIKGEEEIPDSDTLEDLTCSASEVETDESERVRSAKLAVKSNPVSPGPSMSSSKKSKSHRPISNGVETRGQKRKSSEVIIVDDVPSSCNSAAKKHSRKDSDQDDDPNPGTSKVRLVPSSVKNLVKV